jgi:hypothetical protein
MQEDLTKVGRVLLGALGVMATLTAGWAAVGLFVGLSIRVARWVIEL